MPDSSDTLPVSPSSRSQRVIDNAKRNPFAASLGAAVPLLALLPALFEHLEKIEKINSALGYQLGTFAALGLLVLGAYHKHQEMLGRERDADRTMRTEAWIAALEREGQRNRDVFTGGYVDLKNAQAATDRKVDALTVVASEIRDRLDVTGPQRRYVGGGR